MIREEVLLKEVVETKDERFQYQTFEKTLTKVTTCFPDGEIISVDYLISASNIDSKKWYDTLYMMHKIYHSKTWAMKYFRKLNNYYQLKSHELF